MRLFIAVNFPSGVLADLDGRVARLRPRLPSASWTRPESHHLTLAFLGEQPESLIESIARPLAKAVASAEPFEALLAGCGFFPNARRARVGWVGAEPGEKFIALAAGVRDVVTANGVTLDRGEFRPHLTLMRIRDAWPPASIDLFSRSLKEYRSEAFPVDAVTLFSSRLDAKGAVHTPQRAFPLGA
jgi:RNA 2',3'-cyclic 3'-phosphodiesterase